MSEKQNERMGKIRRMRNIKLDNAGDRQNKQLGEWNEKQKMRIADRKNESIGLCKRNFWLREC